jgi:hypothetical protein
MQESKRCVVLAALEGFVDRVRLPATRVLSIDRDGDTQR